jgi:hypothetical protein
MNCDHSRCHSICACCIIYCHIDDFVQVIYCSYESDNINFFLAFVKHNVSNYFADDLSSGWRLVCVIWAAKKQWNKGYTPSHFVKHLPRSCELGILCYLKHSNVRSLQRLVL